MSNNVNGSTWFGIRLDNSQLSQDAQRSNQIFKSIGNTAQAEGSRIDNIFKRATMAAGAFFTLQAAGQFATQIATVRGEFQQLEVAFSTLLQSKAKATALMAQMVQTAIKTPFTLQQVASGAKQLIAYGFASEGVNDTLIRLGNIASGLGLPLERLTYLYGTTMTQGRLYTRDLIQFTTSGIPMLQGLADVFGVSTKEIMKMVEAGKIGFPEVQKVIENLTKEGGKFYNLMEEQSKTITGQISNLKDKISLMFNEIGQNSEGMIGAVIGGAQSLVTHYDEVGRILAVLVITYGTYRAALIAIAAAQKIALAAQMITEWYTMGKALGFATANQMLFNTAAGMNPYVLIASVLVGAVSALILFGNAAETAADAQAKMNEVITESYGVMGTEMDRFERLRKIMKDGNEQYTVRKNALDEIKKIVPDYLGSLDKEGKLINDNSDALDNYVKRLKLTAQIRVASERLGTASADESAYISSLTAREKFGIIKGQSLPKYTADGGATTDDDRMRASGLTPIAYRAITENLRAYKAKTDQYSSMIDGWTKEMLAVPTAGGNGAGGDDDPTTELKNAQKAFAKETKDQAQKLKDSLVDIKKAETTDKIKQIEIERDAAIAGIKQEQADYTALAKKAGVKNPDTKVFENRINAQNDLAKAKTKEVSDEAAKDAADTEKKKLDDLLSQYRTFEGKRLALDTEYTTDTDRLNKALTKATTDAEKKSIQDSLAARKASYQSGLAELENEAMQSTGFYQELFKEISEKGYRTLADLARRTSEVMSSAKTSKSADGKDMITIEIPTIDAAGNQVKKAVTITLEEFTKLQEKSDDITKALQDRNPFKALENAIDNYNNARQSNNKTDEADAIEQIGKAATGTIGQLKAWGNTIGQVFGDDVNDAIGRITDLISGVADLAVGIGKFAAGDVLGGITASASGLVQIFTQITAIIDEEKNEQANLMIAEIEYQRQLDERQIKLIESRSHLAAYANDVELLNKLIAAGYIEEGAADYWSQLSDKAAKYITDQNRETANAANLWAKLQKEWTYEKDKWGVTEMSLKGYNAEQIALFYQQGKLAGNAKKYYEAWVAAGKTIDEIDEALVSLNEEMSALATGMNFDTFLDDALNQLTAAKGDVANFADYTEETIKKALLNSFKYQYLAGQIDKLYTDLSKAMIAGDANENFIDGWIQQYNDTVGGAWSQLEEVFKKAGLSAADISDTRTAATKGIASLSQDSADELNGRFAVIQGHTSQLTANTNILVQNSGKALEHLARIDNNTGRLAAIENSNENMKTSLASMKTTIDDIGRNGIILKK